MHTGSRNQLHLSKLRTFTEWAERRGYKKESTKGDYEILRLRKNREPVLIFWEHIGGDHATTDKRSQPLVAEWIEQRRKREEKI